jgi:hypothetical protein
MTLSAWPEKFLSLLHFWSFWCSQGTQKRKSLLRFFSAKDIFYSRQATLCVPACSVVYGTLNTELFCMLYWSWYCDCNTLWSFMLCWPRYFDHKNVRSYALCWPQTVQHCMILHSLLVTIYIHKTASSCILRWAQYCLCNNACSCSENLNTVLFRQRCTSHNDLCVNFCPTFQLATAKLCTQFHRF